MAQATSRDDVEREYQYRTAAGQYLALGICLVLMGPATAYMGQNAEPGITHLRKLGDFTQDQMHVLGWVAGALFLVIGLKMVSVLLPRVLGKKRIAFTPTAFIYPDPSSGRECALDYRQIEHVAVMDEQAGRVVRVSTPTGNVRFYQCGMKSAADFEELCGLLKERVGKAQS